MSELFEVEGEAYEDFMGRYSRQLAVQFADFAGVGAGQRVLDVGAGTGALTAEVLRRDAEVVAAEPSESFAAFLRRRHPRLEVDGSTAEELPFADDSFDLALAQLVVSFMSDAPAAVAEMARIARRVAVCMWGVDEVEMFAAINRTAEALGVSDGVRIRQYRTAPELRELFAPHGEVEEAVLDVKAGYSDFEEFWNTLSRRAGPAGYWLLELDDAARQAAHDELFRQVGSPSGSFELKSRAFAAAVTRA